MTRSIRNMIRNVHWYLTWFLPRWLTSAGFRETWRVLEIEEEFLRLHFTILALTAYYAAGAWVDSVVEQMSPLIQYIQELEP